jgi:thioredoxin reductase
MGPTTREIPHEMEVEEIDEIVQGYVKSARNAREGNFDGVEIHSGHGYLLQQFLSPWSNKRTDEYGGSLENRMRLANRVIDGIRKECGREFVLGLRISGDELTPGGLGLEDMKVIAQKFASSQMIDYISVSIGNHGLSYALMIGDMNIPLGSAVYLASAIKSVVDLPVFTALRINDPIQAEKILADGHADMIGMCRALICDPELPRKAKEGRLEDIRHCIACNQECLGRVYKNASLSCIYNPDVGAEKEMGIGTLKPPLKKKRVMIIGGGPGGMETARIAAQRGHEVSLYEKSSELGGQINIATKVVNRQEMGEIKRFLEKQIEKLRVEVHLNTEVTRDIVSKINPEAVVVATGSRPELPTIPGGQEEKLLTIWDVLLGRKKIGENVLLVDQEGTWHCYSVAEFLLEQGKNVQILSRFPFVGAELDPSSFIGLYQRALKKGATFIPVSQLKEIRGEKVVCLNNFSGKELIIDGIQTVILSGINRAENGIYRALKGTVREIYAVGDCVAPRRVTNAIYEGNRIARSL